MNMNTNKKTAHYIDNKEFYSKISEWKKQYNEASENGKPKPPVTNYLGECFVKIANHLAYKSNFVNYTFRDEMVLDGIENCLTYISNFDPDKSNNPFAYFTQITYYAFIRRIQKEKRQMETKIKYIQSLDLLELLEEIEGDSKDNEYLKWMRDHLETNALTEQEFNDKNESSFPKRRPKYFDAEIDDDFEELEDSMDEILDNDEKE